MDVCMQNLIYQVGQQFVYIHKENPTPLKIGSEINSFPCNDITKSFKKAENMSEVSFAGDEKLAVKLRHVFHTAKNPFSEYRSEYHRVKALITKGLVMPSEVAIGTRLDSTSLGTQTVSSTVQYVPLKDTLELLYSKDSFRQSLRAGQYVY